MANSSPADLTARIQQLLDDRQRHADALGAVEQTLAQIGALLGGTSNGSALRKPGRPPTVQQTPPADKPARKRGRKTFAMTAEQFVVGFVKQNKKPVSREINAAWKAEGRGHTADNTLGKLVREKKLKRVPLVGNGGARIRWRRHPHLLRSVN
ncbi:MAG TPA: hypothetical protein VIM11_20125 [Tepidisphaeraceae bacterium]